MSDKEPRKNASWTFEKANNLLRVDLPSNKFWQVNLAETFGCFKEMDEKEKKIFQYGIRQYLSDDTAASKENKYTDDDKIRIFDQSLKDMINGTYWKRSGKQTEKISKYVTAQFIDDLAAEMDVPRAVVLKIMERKGLVERGRSEEHTS